MPSISYTDWSGGLDRRLPINVQEASRLWVLRNAFITTGKKIRKRPCLKRVAGVTLTGSFGLATINSQLAVFVPAGTVVSLPFLPSNEDPEAPKPLMTSYSLTMPSVVGATVQMAGIRYADMFQGFPYVVARYLVNYLVTPPGLNSNLVEQFRHHYLDGAPSTIIADANCPQSGSVTKAASRVFAIGGEVVRYCAAGDARDWTTASDAGFLPTGLQQDTKERASAVGTFQDALVVFFSESAQVWDVAVDPSANQIRKRLFGVGSKYPMSYASFANDLMFLSSYGFRSMNVTSNTDRIDDTDTGVPIDPLVTPDVEYSDAASIAFRVDPFGAWIPQLGQYWCVFDTGTTSKVWAYSFSKTSKIACWSEYLLPLKITAIATFNGKVYVRSASSLYEVDAGTYLDDGVSVPVEVQMAFQDAKTPGVSKQFTGADYVMEGSPLIAFKFDPRDQAKETIPQQITGDTRPGEVVPVEVVATALAPVFRHDANEPFEVDQATFYYQVLGAIR